jgi:hypothetical protein
MATPVDGSHGPSAKLWLAYLDSATLLDDSMLNVFPEGKLWQMLILRLQPGDRKTILRAGLEVMEDLARRTVKDDIRADCRSRQEVGFVSRVVRGLFSATAGAGVVASLCQRPVIQFASQKRGSHGVAISDRATDVTTLSRIDQVG